MLKQAIFVAAMAALVVKIAVEDGHAVGPLVYISTPSPPKQHRMSLLRTLGLIPTDCTLVIGHNESSVFTRYTPDGSAITPDTRMPLMSASKLVSAVIILSVFPDPDSVRLQDVLPQRILDQLDKQRRTISVRELLSFTSGVEQGLCEAAATGWESCVLQLLIHSYNPDKRGVFMYARSHLTIAGYMAVVQSGQSWQQLLDEFVVRPANVQPALEWDTRELSNGLLAYDAPVDRWDLQQGQQEAEKHRLRLREHPVPSSGLAGSANQLADILNAILTGRIGSGDEFRRQLFQPQVTAFGAGLWVSYASGNWRDGRGKVAHSQGMFGTFPFLVLDDSNPWFGVFVMDARRSKIWQRFRTL
jgi:CubicO group peptidase (beta-lactamase class C family)